MEKVENGHEFRLYDEKNELIKNCKIWMSGHSFKSNKNGKILIPFGNSNDKNEVILLERNDDPTFNVLSSFFHESEKYSFDCMWYCQYLV